MTNKPNIKFKDWHGNEYDLPDGRTYSWRPSAYAAIVNDNKLLCVKPSWIDRWELPGGEIELHEGLLEAVVREVYEETGYSVKCNDETPIYMTHGFFLYSPR